jgi:hypothetical protein
MPDVYEQLNLTNGVGIMVCGKCSFVWEPRIEKTKIVKCPSCQVRFHQTRQPWPVGYQDIQFRDCLNIPRDWPQSDDPDPEPDIEWQRQQNVLAYRAEQRMKARA